MSPGYKDLSSKWIPLKCTEGFFFLFFQQTCQTCIYLKVAVIERTMPSFFSTDSNADQRPCIQVPTILLSLSRKIEVNRVIT